MKDLPLELYSPIFIHLPTKHLAKVGLTSRACHQETNRILYRDIDLSTGSGEQLYSWADAVARNSSLSDIVCTLFIPPLASVGPGSNLELDEIQGTLTKAFGAIANLISLKVGFEYHPNQIHYRYLTLGLFKTSRFRLKTFHVRSPIAMTPRELLSFLSTQPTIGDWVPFNRDWPDSGLDKAISEVMPPPSLLPALSIFEMLCDIKYDRPILEFVTSRPLVWLRLYVFHLRSNNDSVIEYVHRCHRTLLHPYYGLWPSDKSTDFSVAVNDIGIIAHRLPALKSLFYAASKLSIQVRMTT